MSDTPTTSRLLKTVEVAERMQLSVSYIRRITRAGQLPHVRISARHRRYTEQAVADFIRLRSGS